MTAVNIEYVDKLHPVFTKQKRIKIIVGGRGSTKSTGIADYVGVKVFSGELWCCAREHQNSIEESVHRTLLEEIGRIGLTGFDETKTGITHISGGRVFYRGLSRNITSLKSTLSGIDGLWIEEGEDLSDNTLRVLTASVRLNATDTQRKIEGEEIKMPEIIITMNRGARNGAVAKKWLARAERELGRCGFYEDDLMMVVEMNYTDMPEDWFLESGLEQERLDDMEKLSRIEYDHKWLGHYMDAVDGSIILPEWFDACVDAHKNPKLEKLFAPHGAIVVAHDPFDDGNDAGGYACRHGSIIKRVASKDKGEIDVVCDWATDLARADNADWFVWDGDGMGTGLKRQVSLAFDGTKTRYHIFKGSLSGKAQDNAQKVYMPQIGDSDTRPKTYAETFKNNRAQFYTDLAMRCYNTYRCVIKGEFIDPDDMISFDSEGIENIVNFKSEICRIPKKPNSSGLIQIMSKQEMKSNDIDSPNEVDSVMMSLFKPQAQVVRKPIVIPNAVNHYR
jgi:phage terminase large subunit